MFALTPERMMHRVRWVLTVAWLVLIASLFFDPFSAQLTQPDHPWSPLRLDPNACVQVQGVCLERQPYPLGATLFWGAIVPAAILILLVFGHELWRRICPLSFLSQIPRALGWQRQFKRENSKTGKVRYELAKVKPDSWLGRNYPYLQFGWLFVGLCGRILFFNADRLILALWLLFTVAAAIAVGYFYGGKSWCQYFCPMAPVQKIYGEPGGLLTSKAHMGDQTVTQSMCRIVTPEGKEQSACVACQNPCIDIDAERSYWDGITRPDQTLLYYGYLGLIIGYFGYYYLYAGNWSYYFSGAWSQDPNQLASLLKPGFYIAGQAIPIPKLVAVPLTLGLTTAIGYWSGEWLEKQVQASVRQHHPQLAAAQIRHRIFTVCTFFAFNFFFIFGGRPLVLLLPIWVQALYEAALILLSSLWLYKTWRRTPDLYSRESLASRFRKQLERLQLNVGQFLEGRSLSDLNTHEVYVLAKVLPGFTKEKRHEAYKGVVREALQEGYINYSSSLEVLQQMRQELGISEEEHRQVLEEVGIEDPNLLNPDRQRNLENQVRLSGYRKSLERLMALQQQSEVNPSLSAFEQLLQADAKAVRNLRREYSISLQEEEQLLAELEPETAIARRAESLIQQLTTLIDRHRTLHQPLLQPYGPVLTLLRDSVLHKKQLLAEALLEMLAQLKPAMAMLLAASLSKLSSQCVQDVLADPQQNWASRLNSEIFSQLSQPGETPTLCALDLEPSEIQSHLEALLEESNPLVPVASLYLLAQLNRPQALAIANEFLIHDPVTQETATVLLQHPEVALDLANFPLLEKLVYLYNSDFFHRIQGETLIDLAQRSQIKIYQTGETVTEEGDTCRELLLLIAGAAQIQYHRPDQSVQTEDLTLGQILDELEVLAHSQQRGTILATAAETRILAIPVDTFDDLLDRDRDFARRVLEMESLRLQQFMQTLPDS